MKKIILFSTCFIAFSCAFGSTNNANIEVCFTPYQDCEGVFVRAIDGATERLDVQEYHLTNRAIVASILRAKSRGVQVRVVLDKHARKEITPFINAGIPVAIDYKPRIAHNKVVIIDGYRVVGGSFNPTEGAKHNTENLTMTDSHDIAALYEQNFEKRLVISVIIKMPITTTRD
jgi:phosphatidylserine/phosphatidylglycerophosphate/cardiolipin synthase-like enzyme